MLSPEKRTRTFGGNGTHFERRRRRSREIGKTGHCSQIRLCWGHTKEEPATGTGAGPARARHTPQSKASLRSGWSRNPTEFLQKQTNRLLRQGRRHWPPSVKVPEVFSPRAQSYNSLGVHSTGWVGGGGWSRNPTQFLQKQTNRLLRQGRRHWPPSVKVPEVFSSRAQSYNSLGVHSTGWVGGGGLT